MPSLQLDSSEQNGVVDVEKTKAQDSPVLSQRRIEFHLARKGLSASPSTCNFSLVTLNPCSSTLSTRPLLPSSSDKRNPYDFFDSTIDAELSFRIPSLRIGAGLENLGNTCFLNSVIQCLTYTEPLVAYMQSGKHHYSCHVTGFCALCAIHKHVSSALQSTGRILAPKDLVSNLRCISRNFRNARQEDAHEYMIHLLESMHKCSLPSGVLPESTGAYEKSLVYKIFGGRLRSQVKCLQCSYCSNTFDPFLDLSLEIVKADSLYKALAHFTAAEQLDDGERQYKCERCKQKVKAFKQLTIYKAPYVLGIHLKRFRSYLAEKKIDKKVHFGTTLDLKPFVSGAYEGDMMYKLYGVLVHAGWSTRSGHYYCFVRTSSGLWYSLDDRRVVQVSERTVLEQKAYMLFYVRDRKNFNPKEARDDVQTENFVTTMQNASNSCSIPGVNVFQNGCVDKHSTKTISPAFVVKDSESSKASEILVQQNISQSAIQPSSDSGICKEEVPERTMDIHSVGNKLKRKLPYSKGSIPTKSRRFTLRRLSLKMILKSRIVGMHLSTKMLYGASLSLRNRRKCRRAKQSKKSVLQEHLLTKDLVSVDFGPSTSGSDSCRGEGAKDSAKKCSMSYDSNSSIVNHVRELEDKITCRKTVLVTGKLPQESANCSLEANLIGVGDSSYPKQLNSQLQNGVNVTGSRGEEEIAVGRWEGIVRPEKSNGRNSFSIGYVPDDWDEEYDRGKRKKVRVSRNGFDRPNPFQETAVKKAKLKAKTDAASQRFRI